MKPPSFQSQSQRHPISQSNCFWPRKFRQGSAKLAILGIAFATIGCDDTPKSSDQKKDDSKTNTPEARTPSHLSKLTNELGAELVYLEGGTFMMGSPENETRRDLDEHRHQVTLTTGFYFWSTEVTQKQWKAIIQTEPWEDGVYTRSGDQLPTGGMTMAAAKSFCTKLTDLEREKGTLPKGFEYRLPTEAEWEYACRAGSETTYFFGDNGRDLLKYGRFNLNSEGEGVLKVATRKPNPWGLYDMHGNVWELCLDQVEWEVGPNAIRHLINDVYKDKEGVVDPWSQKGSEFVLRGGAWNRQDYGCRSANRSAWDGKISDPTQGLRPVLALLKNP